MSRIGKQPIPVPSGVKVAVDGRKVSVEGKKGNLSFAFPDGVKIALANDVLTIDRAGEGKKHRAMHGTARALLANMVKGCSEGFTKILEIHGTGFSASSSGDSLELDIGFSNKIKVKIPSDLEVKVDKARPIVLHVSGADKQRVGQLCAVIRSKRPPTPFSDNKGIRYRGETIRKKAGKAFGEKK